MCAHRRCSSRCSRRRAILPRRRRRRLTLSGPRAQRPGDPCISAGTGEPRDRRNLLKNICAEVRRLSAAEISEARNEIPSETPARSVPWRPVHQRRNWRTAFTDNSHFTPSEVLISALARAALKLIFAPRIVRCGRVLADVRIASASPWAAAERKRARASLRRRPSSPCRRFG
jgi:hypothetical protein